CAEVLFNQKHCSLDASVSDQPNSRRLRLRVEARSGLVGQQYVQSLLSSSRTQMAFDHPRTKIECRQATRASDEITVLNEELIGYGDDIAMALEQIKEMVPAHTALSSLQELCFRHCETARAHAGDRNAAAGGIVQELQHGRVILDDVV